MLEPPGQSSASQAAERADQAGSGARTADVDAVPRSRMPRWGRYPAWAGVLMVLGAAVLGSAFTVASHRDPGRALGICIVAGTVVAGTSVKARSAYAIIPVPALAYAAAAGIAELIHDHATGTSRTVLTLTAVQWFASGFAAMTGATAVAILLAIARWLLSRLGQRSSP